MKLCAVGDEEGPGTKNRRRPDADEGMYNEVTSRESPLKDKGERSLRDDALSTKLPDSSMDVDALKDIIMADENVVLDANVASSGPYSGARRAPPRADEDTYKAASSQESPLKDKGERSLRDDALLTKLPNSNAANKNNSRTNENS